MKKLCVVLAVAWILAACEKEITVDLNTAETRLVIDGAVTNEPGPYTVRISRSVGFSESNTFPAVSDALVIIEDDLGTSDTLTEAGPGRYLTSRITGQPGRTYHLRVEVEDQWYYASSTMPSFVPLDSVRFNLFSSPANTEDVYAAVPVFRDPAGSGNYYRFIQTINGDPDGAYIVFNDNINDGLINERPIFSPEAEIKLGDSVEMEMRCIDSSTYQYFFTLSQMEGGGPGGGTAPSNPPTNFTGDEVLGIFTAYTAQRKVQVVK